MKNRVLREGVEPATREVWILCVAQEPVCRTRIRQSSLVAPEAFRGFRQSLSSVAFCSKLGIAVLRLKSHEGLQTEATETASTISSISH